MKLTINKHRIWNLRQVNNFVEKTQESVGGILGWSYLSHDMQRAKIADEVLRILFINDRDNINTLSARCLYMDMMRVAGLINDQEEA